MNLLGEIYVEWIQDLRIPPEQILLRIIEKKDEEIEFLKRDNSCLRKRLNNGTN